MYAEAARLHARKNGRVSQHDEGSTGSCKVLVAGQFITLALLRPHQACCSLTYSTGQAVIVVSVGWCKATMCFYRHQGACS